MLILDAGPNPGGTPNFGTGSPARRKFSTQINLGQYQPNNPFSTTGSTFFAYEMYMIEANQINASVQREPRVVGGGSYINLAGVGSSAHESTGTGLFPQRVLPAGPRRTSSGIIRSAN